MSNLSLLKKLSYKTVCGKINRRELPEDKSTLHVMRVIGVANKLVTGNSDFGAFVGFLGNFEATNVKTGEVFRSGQMFLPPIASNLLEAAIAHAEGKNVEFGFDIGVKEDDASAVGYIFTATPLIDAGESDPVAMLKSRITAPALPAPKTQPVIADETKKETDSGETNTESSKKEKHHAKGDGK